MVHGLIFIETVRGPFLRQGGAVLLQPPPETIVFCCVTIYTLVNQQNVYNDMS